MKSLVEVPSSVVGAWRSRITAQRRLESIRLTPYSTGSSTSVLMVISECGLLLLFFYNFTITHLSVHAAWVLFRQCGWNMAFCREFGVWAGLRVRSFDITPMSDLPNMNGHEGFRLGSFSAFCRRKTTGGGHFCVVRGFLHASTVPALGTSMPGRLCCLCHPAAHPGVGGLLLTQEWRGRG